MQHAGDDPSPESGAQHLGDWSWDSEDGAVHWTPTRAGAPLLAHDAASTLPQWLACLREGQRASVLRTLQYVADRPQPYTLRFDVRDADGWRPVWAFGTASQDGEACVLRMALYGAPAGDGTSSGERAVDAVAVLGHEMRNMLHPMRQALGLVSTGAGSESARERALAILARQIEHLARLVDDSLDAARLGRGKFRLQKQLLRLGDLVGGVEDVTAPVLGAKQQLLEVACDQPEARLHADPLRLAQAVTNLVLNASRHSPPGARVLLAAVVDGDTARIRVADHGAGIPPERLGRLFEPFWQAEDGKDGGLGVGLYVVRNVAELHGGGVSAHSDGPGQGAHFDLWLPLQDAPTQDGA